MGATEEPDWQVRQQGVPSGTGLLEEEFVTASGKSLCLFGRESLAEDRSETYFGRHELPSWVMAEKCAGASSTAASPIQTPTKPRRLPSSRTGRRPSQCVRR